MNFKLFLTTMVQWDRKVDPVREVLDDFVYGWLTGPRGLEWLSSTSGRGDGRPMIVDNDAWHRFQCKIEKSPEEVMEEVSQVAEFVMDLGHPVYLCNLPDVVGDWKKTLSNAWSVDRDYYSLPWALAIQDGFKLKEVEEYLSTFPKTKLFIGGSSHWFKRKAVQKLRTIASGIHVGRVTSMEGLLWANHVPEIGSVDNSTFSRAGMKSSYGGNVHLMARSRLEALETQTTLGEFL